MLIVVHVKFNLVQVRKFILIIIIHIEPFINVVQAERVKQMHSNEKHLQFLMTIHHFPSMS